jgi:hypothetical protein
MPPRISISDADYLKVKRDPWGAELTDLNTGKRYVVCGIDCSFPNCGCDNVVIVKKLNGELIAKKLNGE